MDKLPKQDAGKSGGETAQDDFSAEEIAQESAYQDSTEIAQQMRRGDEESKDQADERDEVGSSKLLDWDQRQVQDKPKP